MVEGNFKLNAAVFFRLFVLNPRFEMFGFWLREFEIVFANQGKSYLLTTDFALSLICLVRYLSYLLIRYQYPHLEAYSTLNRMANHYFPSRFFPIDFILISHAIFFLGWIYGVEHSNLKQPCWAPLLDLLYRPLLTWKSTQALIGKQVRSRHKIKPPRYISLLEKKLPRYFDHNKMVFLAIHYQNKTFPFVSVGFKYKFIVYLKVVELLYDITMIMFGLYIYLIKLSNTY